MRRKTLLALSLLGSLCVVNCGGGGGGGGGGNSTATPSSISGAAISPNPVAVGQTAVGVATVNCTGAGTCYQTVTWSAPANGGAFSGAVYTAPATAGTYALTVAASGYPAVNATVNVTVVTIAVSPATSTVAFGGNQQFILLENGAAVSGVTWSMTGVGTITSGGLYSASAAGTATITGKDASGNSATATVTVPSVSVSGVSCSPASVPQGQTSTCTATVNAANTAVTWSASAGTITAAGVLSVPVSVASGTQIAVTATSVADPTKSATTTVAVTPRVITIGTQYPTISLPSVTPKSIIGRLISTTGTQAGDVASMTFLGQTTTTAITSAMVSAGGFEETITLDLAHYSPGYIKVIVASADGTIQSNVVWIAVTTDQQVLVKNATTAYFVPGFQFVIQEYSLTNGSKTGTIAYSGFYSAAFDDKSGNFLAVAETGNAVLDFSTNGGVNTNSQPMAVAAKSGLGYVTEPSAGQVGQWNLAQSNPTLMSVAAGNNTWTIDASTVNGADAVAAYSKEDTTISLFDKNLNLKSYLTLTGVTAASVVQANTAGTGGGWPIRFIGSQIALLGVPNNLLVFASISSSNVLREAGRVTLTGNPSWIAADSTNNRIVVVYDDLTNGKTIIRAYNAATYAETDIVSASTLPTGFAVANVLVSDDGKNLYVAGIDATGNPAFFILANQ